jgi:hypothetical protein
MVSVNDECSGYKKVSSEKISPSCSQWLLYRTLSVPV